MEKELKRANGKGNGCLLAPAFAMTREEHKAIRRLARLDANTGIRRIRDWVEEPVTRIWRHLTF